MIEPAPLSCCDQPSPWGLTRREFLRTGGRGVLALGLIATIGCEPDTDQLPRKSGMWALRGDAPFSRHAHSGAVSGKRFLVMGDRRGVAISDSEDGDDGEVDKTIHFIGSEFKFETDVPVEVKSGERVRVIFTNEGLVDHDLTFSKAGVYLKAAPGQSKRTTVVFESSEVYFCSIGGHAQSGMVGDLVVDGLPPPDQEVGPVDGSTQMWWYDPTAGIWEEAPRLPHALDHVTMVSVADDVYSVGGYAGDIGSSSAEVYVLTAGAAEWQKRAELPVRRGAMAGASDGERLFVAGGRSEKEGTPSSGDLFVYDPADDSWDDSRPSMPTGRDHVAGTFHDGVFWVIGGRGDGQRESSTPVTEGYDTRSGEWIVGSATPVPTSANGLAVLDGRIVLFGGEGPTSTVAGAAGRDFEVYAETLFYEPATDSWTRGPNAPVGVHHPAYGVIDETLYLVGGGIVSGVSSTRTVQSFRSET